MTLEFPILLSEIVGFGVALVVGAILATLSSILAIASLLRFLLILVGLSHGARLPGTVMPHGTIDPAETPDWMERVPTSLVLYGLHE
tara:strand:- start:173 stop:433 length:261 start_codon:yes stop_codon:yes gene_type:complete